MSASAHERPWIVLPVHNRREVTLTGLRHLTALGELDRHTVLIVDDGSTDGTAEAVARHFPGVLVLPGDGNLWWTGAIALGMTHAFTRGATAVCWLNDDCLPEAGTLAALAAESARHGAAVTAPVCIADDTGAPVCTAFTGRRNLSSGDAAVQRVDGVSGYCVWIPREVWQHAGVPDRIRFPHYYGDTSYLLQAGRRGHATLLLSTHRVRIAHHRDRAASIQEFAGRTTRNRDGWDATFVSLRSPFRLTTQFHYLMLRYGRTAGPVLFILRFFSWQIRWLVAARLPQPRGGQGPNR